MPLLTIVTPLAMRSLPFLGQARESLLKLELPEGWTMEWCIQQDGADPPVECDWFDEPWISYGYNGRQLGAGATRNQILTRAKGEFIFPLDADDILHPEAIKILAEGIQKSDDIGWSAGRWDELYDEDQTTKEWRHVADEGIRPTKWLAEEIKRTGQTPFAMSPVLYRTNAILELGGWPGFPEWEDSLLLIAVNRHWRGWATNKLIGYYRRHANQTTKDPRFKESKPTMYPYLIHVGTI